eukprot:scaffold17698_cov29-Prasinocladus_malaysianus.AAC.1
MRASPLSWTARCIARKGAITGDSYARREEQPRSLAAGRVLGYVVKRTIRRHLYIPPLKP